MWFKNLLYVNTLGEINKNILLMIFLMAIYIQLGQKYHWELDEDIKKNTF